MSLFADISKRCDELTAVAQEYLDSLPFIPSDECAQRIWTWAWQNVIVMDNGTVDWENSTNSFALEIIDSGIPYYGQITNGSIHYSLGWSVVAQDANLRKVLEYVEGRSEKIEPFQMLAEL